MTATVQPELDSVSRACHSREDGATPDKERARQAIREREPNVSVQQCLSDLQGAGPHRGGISPRWPRVSPSLRLRLWAGAGDGNKTQSEDTAKEGRPPQRVQLAARTEARARSEHTLVTAQTPERKLPSDRSTPQQSGGRRTQWVGRSGYVFPFLVPAMCYLLFAASLLISLG